MHHYREFRGKSGSTLVFTFHGTGGGEPQKATLMFDFLDKD